MDTISEWSQDFTDSAYTSHEHRENILLLADRIRLQLNQLLRVAVSLVSYSSFNYDLSISFFISQSFPNFFLNSPHYFEMHKL